MKKLLCVSLILTLAIFSLFSCSEAKNPNAPVGSYIFDGEGFGGDFQITVSSDGSFSYYEGMLSSYLATGEWSFEDGILCLEDKHYDFVNYFEVDDDKLYFIEEGSTNFLYIKLSDGAEFNFTEG